MTEPTDARLRAIEQQMEDLKTTLQAREERLVATEIMVRALGAVAVAMIAQTGLPRQAVAVGPGDNEFVNAIDATINSFFAGARGSGPAH